MPFLAPLIPIMMSIIPEIGAGLGALGSATGLGGLVSSALALPEAAGGLLAGPLAGLGTAIGIPSAIATPLAGFLSPEIIGGGLGEAFGGTKGLEEGLLAGATMGGGLGSLGDLLGTAASSLGAPGAVSDALIAGGQAGGVGALGLQAASPFIQSAIAGMPTPPNPTPSKTVTPTPTATTGAAPPGGPSGLSLAGNTAPQVGPWLSNFWNPGGSAAGSTGNVPMVGSAAPATSMSPSATNQQQLTSP
jgi:hypothetical protein